MVFGCRSFLVDFPRFLPFFDFIVVHDQQNLSTLTLNITCICTGQETYENGPASLRFLPVPKHHANKLYTQKQYSVFVLSYYVCLCSEFRVVLSVMTKTMLGSSLHPVVCRMTHVLFTLLFPYGGVFVLFFVVLCTLCCQFLWIVHSYCSFGIL